MCGTAAEVPPVGSFDGRQIGAGKAGPVTRRMQEMVFGLFDGTTPDKYGWLELAGRAGRLLQERLKPLLQKSTASSLGVGDRERQRRHHAALLARHHADLPVVQAAQPAHDRQADAAAQRMLGMGERKSTRLNSSH